uniref:HTH CENPB-type domain-containing protein n=1 Tax=Plectus sambesii TaxID=2011161 RepID=A0A914UV96_9BILA
MMENHEEINEENDRPLLLDMEEVQNENPIKAAQYSQQRKKTSCTLKRKLEVVELIKKFGKNAAANKYLIGELEPGQFTASIGWLQKFMKRNSLCVRKATTPCQKPPSDYMQKLVDFVIYICQQRKIRQYPYGHVYACDETAVWLDPTGANCVTNRGDREVAVLSTGHEKLRITVMLTV